MMDLERDPETGYFSDYYLGHDYGAKVRCDRCGGRAMWPSPLNDNFPGKLCLKCANEWSRDSDKLFEKHGVKDSRQKKKWMVAWAEFLASTPEVIDLVEHNRHAEAKVKMMKLMYPEKKWLRT
jgi:hypothetical protein